MMITVTLLIFMSWLLISDDYQSSCSAVFADNTTYDWYYEEDTKDNDQGDCPCWKFIWITLVIGVIAVVAFTLIVRIALDTITFVIVVTLSIVSAALNQWFKHTNRQNNDWIFWKHIYYHNNYLFLFYLTLFLRSIGLHK